jgi:4-diphosphocytidyl-2-C-methyl-D-erythritol kinase
MSVTLRAPAKLTLSLRLTGVRPDGYHLIDAEMVTLELCDLLTFTDGDALALSGPTAPTLSERRSRHSAERPRSTS